MARLVLLQYLDRNKPVSIPKETDNDIALLTKHFFKNFNFTKNVGLTVTFQRFDEEWDEYVDLDEDAVIQHKEKLKVIVSSSLTDGPQATSTPNEVLLYVHVVHACMHSAY